MLAIRYSKKTLIATLDLLEKGGEYKRECVVLWLGKRNNTHVIIEQAYMPPHRAASDFFHIQRNSMDNLKQYLRERRLVVGAQVHTHPGAAFHSKADDEWAFVRHEGAISIVLPQFAKGIKAENFMQLAAVFSLSKNNTWNKIQGMELTNICSENT